MMKSVHVKENEAMEAVTWVKESAKAVYRKPFWFALLGAEFMVFWVIFEIALTKALTPYHLLASFFLMPPLIVGLLRATRMITTTGRFGLKDLFFGFMSRDAYLLSVSLLLIIVSLGLVFTHFELRGVSAILVFSIAVGVYGCFALFAPYLIASRIVGLSQIAAVGFEAGFKNFGAIVICAWIFVFFSLASIAVLGVFGLLLIIPGGAALFNEMGNNAFFSNTEKQ